MEALFTTANLSQAVLLLGLSTLRIAVAFVLLPLFSPDVMPPLVRNAIFLALALLSLALQPTLDLAALGTLQWLRLAAKEVFVGAAIGLLFGSMLWAFDAAGQVIDLKTGASMAQVVDPLSGHQTPLTGAFLSRLAGFVFMFSGGLLLLAGIVLKSYALWPVAQALPAWQAGGARLFEAEFGRLMSLTLLISAPALVVLYLIDGVFGLVNRYAQQLNVFSLASSFKVLAANAMLLLMLGSLVQMLIDDIQARPAVLTRALGTLMGSR